VAGNKRPSFLKRQKEQKRLARAAEKREARRLKKQNNATAVDDSGDSDIASLEDLIGIEADTEAEEAPPEEPN
jgi:hypothetical protein